MASLTAASNALPASQVSLYQSRLQQARRDAADAEEQVRSLESETEKARSQAVHAESNVRTIERQAPEGHAPRQPSMVNTQGQLTGRVLSTLA